MTSALHEMALWLATLVVAGLMLLVSSTANAHTGPCHDAPFGMSALMALAVSWAAFGSLVTVRAVEWFIAFAMCLLALQKLGDVESFATMFLGYDLLAQRWVPYATIYPYAEELAGVLMIAGALMWISVPVALFIGMVGAVSVFKAVYVDKRELKCACVGGDSNVPLGFVSLPRT